MQDALESSQQYAFSSIFKMKMRALICFEKLNTWKEKRL